MITDKNNFSMFLNPVDEAEIYDVIASLNNSSSNDIYNLNIKLIKAAAPVITPVLVHIINNCFETGVFPDILKLCKVIPVHKKGDKDDVDNYRPVTITPVFSKVIEKALKNRLMNFLNKYNILSRNQFGFRPKKSTINAVITLIESLIHS